LDSGRVPLQIKKTDIQKLIAEKIAEKNEVLGVTKLQIINNVKDSIMLYIDPLRISEVLNNLLENARKYMKDDGTVTINSQINKREVIISVEDNGIGMSEDTIKHLFNEFYKADESRHDFSSFGLGLSICKKIIDMHGGKIWVESGGLGKGSTFYFSLPIKADL
jgi:signal transduction histidine kinase